MAVGEVRAVASLGRGTVCPWSGSWVRAYCFFWPVTMVLPAEERVWPQQRVSPLQEARGVHQIPPRFLHLVQAYYM